MTLSEFQSFVAAHREKFAGVHAVVAADFEEFEHRLGFSLPESIKWLLGTHGYSQSSGIDDLAESVEQTIQCRRSIALPKTWLLLNDWGDAGVVLLDLTSGRVCWCAAHNADNLAFGVIDADADWFDGYPEWAVNRVEAVD